MRQKEFDILLDIKKPSLATDIEVVQDDINANVFNISLVDGLEPFNLTGTSVDIVFSKSDGTTVVQSSNDSASNVAIVNETQGKIQCVLKTNTIASPGKTIAEVKVSESGMLLTSAKFNFHVRKSLLNSDTVESTNEFPILKKLVDDVQDAIEKMPEVEEKLNEVTNTNSELNQNIQTGTGLKAELDTSIENANTTKIALDGSIAEGNNIKDELHDIIANTNYEQVLQGLNNKLDKTGDSSNNIVTFTEAEEDKDIQSGETHSTLFGKILKSIKTLRAALNNKLNKTDLVNTDQVNDPDKATSSAVTYAHGQAIAQLNNNLAKMPFTCTALSGYTIVSSNCFVQNKIAYINLRIEKIDGSSFSSDIQDIATVPHTPVSAVTALCAIGLSAGGALRTIEQCGIYTYNRSISIKPASTDTKSVYITGTYEINNLGE